MMFLRITFWDGTTQKLELKNDTALNIHHIRYMVAKTSGMVTINHKYGSSTMLMYDIRAADLLKDNCPWDYEDPLN